MTEQQFLIALLREMATGAKTEDIQKFVLDRMSKLEEQRTGKTITFNEFKEKYLPIAPIGECQHDYNYAWGSVTPQPCRKCGKIADGNFASYSIATTDTDTIGDAFDAFGKGIL